MSVKCNSCRFCQASVLYRGICTAVEPHHIFTEDDREKFFVKGLVPDLCPLVKVYEIKPVDYTGGGLVVKELSTIAECMGDLDYEEVGNKYVLEVKEMTEDEIDNLGEWGGF